MKRVAAAFGLAVIAGLGLAMAMWPADDSPLTVGSVFPAVALPPVEGVDRPGFSTDMLAGRVSVINLFASWCGPCRQEHPLLTELKRETGALVFGINVQDLPENAARFLADLGNPYDGVGSDPNRALWGELGIVGIPHTLVVDASGRLLISHPGPLTDKAIKSIFSKL
jgi:cytochrome c biogenesis protein CcmG/thiol:disulfide interchange protein DsbE